MRTGEKAGRTAAKRRTEVRRLCVRTILQGDELLLFQLISGFVIIHPQRSTLG